MNAQQLEGVARNQRVYQGERQLQAVGRSNDTDPRAPLEPQSADLGCRVLRYAAGSAYLY